MKREVATAGLFYAAGVGLVAIFKDSEMAFRVLEVTLAPVMLFAGGAFGFDAWSKQSAAMRGGKNEDEQ